MAAKKQPKNTLPETPAELPDDFAELLTAEDVNPALERIYAEMGVDGEGRKSQIYVYKEMQDGADARIWTGSPDDYNLEPLTKKFGSGSYRIKVYAEHESGRMVVKANQVIKILLDPAEDARIAAARNPQQPQQQGGNVDPNAMALMIARAVADAMPKQQPQQQPDMLAMLNGLAGIVQRIVPQPTQPQTPAFNPIDALKMGIELARDNSGGDSGSPMLRVIEKMAPAFLGVLQQAQPMQQPQQPAVLPAPAQMPQQPIQETPEMFEAAKQKAAQLALQQGLLSLCEKAARNADVALYADFVADNVDENTLAQFLDNPEWFAYLVSVCPEVGKYQQWFTDLRNAVAALYEPEAPEVAAAPANPVVDSGSGEA